MFSIDQKSVCLAIRDGLTSELTSSRIIANKEYTHVRVTSSKEIRKPDIYERVMQILEKQGCEMYRPFWNRQNKFVAIKDKMFADIDIRTRDAEGKFEYNVYIYISPTNIEFEWWYDMYMEKK